MKRNRRRDRPTNAEVNEAFFKMDRVQHYSQDVMRKLDMGKKKVQSGDNAEDVCKRLFGHLNQDLVDLMLNED